MFKSYLRIILSAAMLASFVAGAQNTVEDRNYIKDIKEGALLFRMTSNMKKMQALMEADRQSEMEDLKRETAETINRWKQAFSTHYDFGKVYFFNDFDGYGIKEGYLDGKIFDLKGEAVRGFSGPYIIIGPDITENLSLNGLVLLDENMEQLPKSSVNFISAYRMFKLKKKTEAEMVIELNDKLTKRWE